MKWIAISIVFSLSCFAQHLSEPYSVKGDRLGENLATWKANNPRFDSCDGNAGDRIADPDVVYCVPRSWEDGQSLSFAGSPLLAETTWFYKGSLYKIEMTLLSTAGLANIMTGLKTTLGTPNHRQTKTLRNGFGFKFDRHRWTWTNKVSTAELVYSNTGDDCPRITFTLDGPNKTATASHKIAELNGAPSGT